MPETPKLELCPHCGNPPTIERREQLDIGRSWEEYFVAFCSYCSREKFTSAIMRDTEIAAAKAWNKKVKAHARKLEKDGWKQRAKEAARV